MILVRLVDYKRLQELPVSGRWLLIIAHHVEDDVAQMEADVRVLEQAPRGCEVCGAVNSSLKRQNLSDQCPPREILPRAQDLVD